MQRVQPGGVRAVGNIDPMNHPEIFAIPVLMFADYYLTIAAARLRRSSGYDEHFAVESYEMNPLFQKDVDSLRWFNPRHMAISCLVTAALLLIDWATSDPFLPEFMRWIVPFLWGFLATMFLAVIGRHLANIISFRAFQRNPGDLSGRVEMARRHVLQMSGNQYLEAVLPLVLPAVLVPSALTLGCLLGAVRLVIAHLQWAAAQTKKAARETPAPVE